MTIRTMREDDYDAVRALWERTPGVGLGPDDGERGVAQFLRRNPATCFVAEKEGRIVGVLLSGHDGRRGYIYHMAVEENLRRRGTGKRLLAAAEAALYAQGIRKIALVAFRSNEGGNRFWQSAGYAERTDLCYRNKRLDG